MSPQNGARTDRERSPEGEECDDGPDDLGAIFTEITGVASFVEKQVSTNSTRYIDSGEETSVSEYVTEMVRDDGLSEAISPNEGEEMI